MTNEELSKQDWIREELELIAAMRTACSIRFCQANGAEVHLKTQIDRVYEEEGIGYIATNEGLQIPLGQVIEVNGIAPQGWC